MDIITGEVEKDYYPPYKGNDKSKGWSVRLKQLTGEELDECTSIDMEKSRIVFDRPKMLRFGVVGIKDLSWNGKPVETADDLLAAPKSFRVIALLVGEIQAMSILDEDDEKNS